MNDPAHRYIVFETDPTGTGLLPPAGTRTGPQYEAVLGGIIAQVYTPTNHGAEVLWGSDTSQSEVQHHFYIRNMQLGNIQTNCTSTAVDPRPWEHMLYFDSRNTNQPDPQFNHFDRLLLTGGGLPCRNKAAAYIGGSNVSFVNSYISIDNFHAITVSGGLPTRTSGNTVLNLPAATFTRKTGEIWTTSTATATLTSGGGYTGDVICYFGSNGAWLVDYEAPTVGTVSIACSGCTATQVAAGTLNLGSMPYGVQDLPVPANTRLWAWAAISGGTYGAPVGPTTDSWWVTSEGSIGISIVDGAGPHNISNNYVMAPGLGFFIDNSGAKVNPSDLTFLDNDFYLPTSVNLSHAASDGYSRQYRNLWEIKRGKRIRFERNTLAGNASRVNQGSTFLLSTRNAQYIAFFNNIRYYSYHGISDVTFRNNLVKDSASGFYCQGATNAGDDPPTARRVLVENNIFQDLDQFTHQDSPPNQFGGEALRMLSGGCLDMAWRNNTEYNTLAYQGKHFMIGDRIGWGQNFVFEDNVMYANLANSISIWQFDGGTDNYPMVPMITATNLSTLLGSTSCGTRATGQRKARTDSQTTWL